MKLITNEMIKTKVGAMNRIKFKLILAFMLPVCCIILLGIVSYRKASSIIIDNYMTSMTQTLDMTGQYYTFSLGTVQADINEFYQDVELRDFYAGIYSITPTQEIKFFNSTLDVIKNTTWSDELIEDIYIISDNQSFLTTKAVDSNLYSQYVETEQGALVAADNSQYHWFAANPDLDELFVSKSSDYVIRMARRLVDADAIIIADINRKEILNILNSLNMGEESVLALVSGDGVEITSTKENEEVKAEGESIFFGSEYYQKAVDSEENSGLQYVEYKKETYLFLYHKIGKTGFIICSLVPKSNVIKQAADIKNVTMIIVPLTCILSILICIIIAGGISKTITYMMKQLKKVAQGDLTVEIKTKRRDEFSFLAQDITDMISNMKILIQKVKDVGMELVSTIDLLADTSKIFVHTTVDIQGAVNDIESGVTQLDVNSEDCLCQMSSLSDKINLVNENTDRISKITNATGQSIDEGIHSMDELNAKAQNTTLITGRVIETIELLETKTKKIGRIVSVINEIAEQTNLLSLNASIESARAGAAGRGFAVVADEIRKLADQSLNSANQIHTIILEIMQNTSEAVKTAKEAEVIVQSQKIAVNNTTHSFGVMDQQIEELAKETSSILANVKNMEQARATTEEAIQSISAVSEETTACSATVSSTVEFQIDAVNRLDDAATKLLSDANNLEEAINQFKIN